MCSICCSCCSGVVEVVVVAGVPRLPRQRSRHRSRRHRCRLLADLVESRAPRARARDLHPTGSDALHVQPTSPLASARCLHKPSPQSPFGFAYASVSSPVPSWKAPAAATYLPDNSKRLALSSFSGPSFATSATRTKYDSMCESVASFSGCSRTEHQCQQPPRIFHRLPPWRSAPRRIGKNSSPSCAIPHLRDKPSSPASTNPSGHASPYLPRLITPPPTRDACRRLPLCRRVRPWRLPTQRRALRPRQWPRSQRLAPRAPPRFAPLQTPLHNRCRWSGSGSMRLGFDASHTLGVPRRTTWTNHAPSALESSGDCCIAKKLPAQSTAVFCCRSRWRGVHPRAPLLPRMVPAGPNDVTTQWHHMWWLVFDAVPSLGVVATLDRKPPSCDAVSGRTRGVPWWSRRFFPKSSVQRNVKVEPDKCECCCEMMCKQRMRNLFSARTWIDSSARHL